MPKAPRFKLAILVISSILFQGCADKIASKRRDLCNFVPERQAFDAARQVEGKVAVVYKGARYDPNYDHFCELDGYSGGGRVPKYFPEEMYARTPEELDTLIMIELGKGDFVKTAKYQMTRSGGWTTDVYSGQLKISMIDYKTSTLLRNSVRVLTNVPDKIELEQLKTSKDSYTNSEYVIEPTTAEIQTALHEFSAKASGGE